MTYFAAPGIIKTNKKRLTVREIEEIVCDYYSINQDLIHERDRKRNRVECRQMIFFIARHHFMLSLREISEHYNFHHTSIIHGIKCFKDRYDTEEIVRCDLLNIKNLIRLAKYSLD